MTQNVTPESNSNTALNRYEYLLSTANPQEIEKAHEEAFASMSEKASAECSKSKDIETLRRSLRNLWSAETSSTDLKLEDLMDSSYSDSSAPTHAVLSHAGRFHNRVFRRCAPHTSR